VFGMTNKIISHSEPAVAGEESLARLAEAIAKRAYARPRNAHSCEIPHGVYTERSECVRDDKVERYLNY